MKGLLLKDILNLKKQGLIYIFLIALCCILSGCTSKANQ